MFSQARSFLFLPLLLLLTTPATPQAAIELSDNSDRWTQLKPGFFGQQNVYEPKPQAGS